jgi:acyl carrier protein
MPTPTDFPDLLSRTRRIIGEDLLATGPGFQDNSDLFDAGLDSMAIMQLLLLLEEEFGTPIPVETVTRENFRTILGVALLVASRLGLEAPTPEPSPANEQDASGQPPPADSAPTTPQSAAPQAMPLPVEDAPLQPFTRLPLKNCDYFVLSFDAMMRAKGEGGHVAHSLLELDSLPDLPALRSALKLATERYPLLSARLHKPGIFSPHHWVPGTEPLPPDLILLCESGTPAPLPDARICEDAETEITRLINTPIPCREDARWVKMRLALIQRRDGTATLMLSWSHFVVDGKGAELFLQALHDLGSTNATSITALDASTPPPDPRHYGQKWQSTFPITIRFDEITQHRFDALAPRHGGKGGPIRYEVRVLDDAQTAAVKARSRTFSEVLNLPFQLACAMRAHQAVFQHRGGVPESLLCSVPIQTRRPGAAGPIFQNHLRMFFGQCLREELRTLEGTVASITSQHQRYLKDGLDKAFDELMNVMRPVPPGIYMKFVSWRMKGLFNSFFHSDTGEFAPGLTTFLGAPIRTAYHIPGFTSPPGTGLFVNEKHGRLVLAACWRGDVVSERERALLWERWLSDLGCTRELPTTYSSRHRTPA